MEKTRSLILSIGLVILVFPVSVVFAYPTLVNGTFDSDLSGWTATDNVAFESDVLTWNPPGHTLVADGHATFFESPEPGSLSQLIALDNTQTLSFDVVMRIPGGFTETDAFSAALGGNTFYTLKSDDTVGLAFGATLLDSQTYQSLNPDGTVQTTWVFNQVNLSFASFANGDYLLDFTTLPEEGNTAFAVDNVRISGPAVATVPAPAAVVLAIMGAALVGGLLRVGKI
jgi:hypothetical protein